jgi:hypothetical protein
MLSNLLRIFMSVFTIFCHGTGGASTKGVEKAEIVNLFSSSVNGKSGSHIRASMEKATHDSDWHKTPVNHRQFADASADHMTLEGVGGAGDPLSKSFDLESGWTVGKNRGASIRHSATGAGVQTNVNNAVNFVLFKVKSGKRPTVINMMGWSRGAVEAIRIAHRLHGTPETSGIPVNIFAIDPVAGLGANHDHDACNVYENVKAFVSIISLGEDRWAFTPMHEQTYLRLNNKEVTKYVPLHMPGVHDTIAKYNNSAGKLAFHLCYRFLKDRGTSMGITDMFAMSDANCLQHYGLLLAKRGGTFGTHAKKKSLFGISYGGSLSKPEKGVPTGQGRWKAYTTGGGYQSRPVELNDFVSSKAIFFNVHHEALFEAQCPATYATYFGISPGVGPAVSNSSIQQIVDQEMTHLKGKIGVPAAEAHQNALDDVFSMQCRNTATRKDFLRDLSLADDIK